MWQKLFNFLCSDLFFWIYLVVVIVLLLLNIIVSILVRIQKRIKDEEFEALLRKYGIPDDYVCPENVGQYISYLIHICEEYNFASLRDAQKMYEYKYFGILKLEPVSVDSKILESKEDKQNNFPAGINAERM